MIMSIPVGSLWLNTSLLLPRYRPAFGVSLAGAGAGAEAHHLGKVL